MRAFVRSVELLFSVGVFVVFVSFEVLRASSSSLFVSVQDSQKLSFLVFVSYFFLKFDHFSTFFEWKLVKNQNTKIDGFERSACVNIIY